MASLVAGWRNDWTTEGRAAGEARLFGLCLIGSLVLTVLVVSLLHPAYQSNDDATMRMIASGFWTGEPSEFLVFISILVGWLLKQLYSLWPGIFWYDILIYGSFVFAAATATYALVRQQSRSRLLLLVVPALVLPLAALQPQFTICAGLCAASAVLLFVSVWHRPPAGRITSLWIAAMIAMCGLLAVLLRTNEAILVTTIGLTASAPFLLARARQAPHRWAATTLAVTIVVSAGAVVLTDAVSARDPTYRDFLTFNEARVGVQEYRTLAWKDPEHRAALEKAGWSQADFELFKAFFAIDPEQFALKKLLELKESTPFAKRTASWAKITTTAQAQVWRLVQMHGLSVLPVLTLIPLFAFWRRGMIAFVVSGAVVIVCCILIALIFKPTPYRVSFPLIFLWLSLAVLFAQGAPGESSGPRSAPLRRRDLFCLLLLCAFSVPAIYSWIAVDRTNAAMAKAFAKDLRRYKPPVERVHVLWSGASKFGSTQYLLLPFQPYPSTLTFMQVGWLATVSPVAIAHAHRLQVQRLGLDLCRRPEFALIADRRPLRFFPDFVRQHYGLDVELKRIFRGKSLQVYRCVEKGAPVPEQPQ